MKIGVVEITKIPACRYIDCENGCEARAVKFRNGVPYCAECLLEEQKKQWDADGKFIVDRDGKEIRYKVVSRVSITEK